MGMVYTRGQRRKRQVRVRSPRQCLKCFLAGLPAYQSGAYCHDCQKLAANLRAAAAADRAAR